MKSHYGKKRNLIYRLPAYLDLMWSGGSKDFQFVPFGCLCLFSLLGLINTAIV